MTKRWIVTHLFYRFTDIILYNILTNSELDVVHRTDVMMLIDATEEAIKKAFPSGWKVVEHTMPEKEKPKSSLVSSGSHNISIGRQSMANLSSTNYSICLGYNTGYAT